jgi:hypothetical protein
MMGSVKASRFYPAVTAYEVIKPVTFAFHCSSAQANILESVIKFCPSCFILFNCALLFLHLY